MEGDHPGSRFDLELALRARRLLRDGLAYPPGQGGAYRRPGR